MNLAYSANAYMRFPVEEAIRRIADLGYAGIELMADAPHLWPEDVTPGLIERVRRLLEDRGLAIANVNAFMMNKIGDPRQPYWHPSWIEPDRAYRQIRIDHTKRALTMAKALGAPCITTEPGGPIDVAAGDPNRNQSRLGTPAPRGGREGEFARELAMETFVEMLRPVVEHAEREGVKLLIEPEPGLLIENMAQWLDLRSRIASPMMGLNYDVGHFYCVSEPLAETIGRLGQQIEHVHVEDIAATRVHHHLVPGDGAIDFPQVLSTLDAIDYRGWVTVELYPFVDDPDTAGRRAREHIQSLKYDRVQRAVMYYSKETEEHLGEWLLHSSHLPELKALYDVSSDDPLMYYCYEVTAREQAVVERLCGHALDLQKYQYFVEAFQKG